MHPEASGAEYGCRSGRLTHHHCRRAGCHRSANKFTRVIRGHAGPTPPRPRQRDSPGSCWLGRSSDDSAATPVNTGIDAAAVDCSVEKSLGCSTWPITRVILRKECRRRATVVHPVCMPRGRELCPCHVSRAEVSESMIRTQGPAATAARACQEHCEPGFMSQAGGSAIWTPYASASVGCRSAQGPVRALIVRDPYHRLLYRELITGHRASGIPRERP